MDSFVVGKYRENYYATTDGRVFSTIPWNGTTFRELKQERMKLGYYRVAIYDGYKKKVLVHIIVIETFVGEKPSPWHEVRHLDGNPANNCIENLAWGTKEENVQDSKDHGTFVLGSRNYNAKLTEEMVIEIRKLIADGFTHKEIADMFNVSRATISNVATRSWQHV